MRGREANVREPRTLRLEGVPSGAQTWPETVWPCAALFPGPAGRALLPVLTDAFSRIADGVERIATWGKNIVAASTAGDEMRTVLAGLRRLTKHDPVNRTRLHDAIAERIVAAEKYTVS